MAKHRHISLHTIHLAASNAEVDDKIAFKVAIGLPVAPSIIRERVAAELRKLGVEVPVVTTADELPGAPPAPVPSPSASARRRS